MNSRIYGIEIWALCAISLLMAGCGGDSKSGGGVEASQTWEFPLVEEHFPEGLKVGKVATEERIAMWDVDIRPDGDGLPAGNGTAMGGKPIYDAKCAMCHGMKGEGGPGNFANRGPRLVGKMPDFSKTESAESESAALELLDVSNFRNKLLGSMTIGGYWPYATTIYDYIYRAMPLTSPGSLEPNEVYSLTAYLLYLNEIIAEDMVINAETLPQIEMPARDRFIDDDRLTTNQVR